MNLTAYFDGSCGPTAHGTAAYGWVIKNETGDVVATGHGRVGHGPDMSSNVAEYEGLYQAMVYVHRHYPDANVVFTGDSTLVITQMKGESKAKKGQYLPYYKKTVEFAMPYIERKQWSFNWIQRDLNSEADELSQYNRF